MWKIIGFYYVFIGPNIYQVLGIEKFEKPQDCFAKAMQVMRDESEPRNMACVPTFTEKGDA